VTAWIGLRIRRALAFGYSNAAKSLELFGQRTSFNHRRVFTTGGREKTTLECVAIPA
jgi:hypothetical protein